MTMQSDECETGLTGWLRANRQDLVWGFVMWLFMGTPACIDLYLAYSTDTPAPSSYHAPATKRETDHWQTDIFDEGESDEEEEEEEED